MIRNASIVAAALTSGFLIAACSRVPDSDVSPAGSQPDPASVPAPTSIRPPLDASMVKIGYVSQDDAMAPGTTSDFSISIENGSGAPLASTGANSTYITYHWLADGEGSVEAWDNPRTPISADVAEGGTITSTFPVIAPATRGRYLLKVVMGINGGLDFETSGQAALHYRVTVQ